MDNTYMDKSWMKFPRNSKAYLRGLTLFLDFAFSQENTAVEGMILCPCKTCKNGICLSREDVEVHLKCVGFINGYTQWIAHGETSKFAAPISFDNELSDKDNMQEMLNDAFRVDDVEMDENEDNETEEPNSEAKDFYQLVDDSHQELWPGCKKFSKLSFLVRLYHIKCLGKMSNKAFTMLLELLNEAFPEGVQLPKSNYQARKVVEKLGLGYKKYDACLNDCTLFWGRDESKKQCETCGSTRWVVSDGDPTGEKRKVPQKVLWHFPLKGRLQRLFMSSKTASFMRWHAENRTKDGNMRHPADSPAWQYFDFKNPEFAKDPRNVRLGLASDGFNPFKSMNVQHSTWPVVLIPYNLPPWMCMKQPYFMMSLLIPGPLAPGNNIDVYMQPLIAELKDLWDGGLETYDASCKQNFKMRASLLWTISDFPGYANLSGWSTKGGLACPPCNKDTESLWLKNSGKYCYMGHRRFLEKDHRFRNDFKSFNGNTEHRGPPSRLSGSSILADLDGFEVKFGKHVSNNPSLPFNWKKKSILLVGIIKKNRGPTYLPDIWTRNSNEGRILVNFNKKGQPIGPNKKKLTGFLGTLARNGKFTPLDIEDWRKVPKTRKDELIRMVKERFEVPKGTKHWILLSIGKKRKQWKSRVKSECFGPTLPNENQVQIRPIRVNEDQWKNLLPYWAKEDVKKTSAKNKDHRKRSIMKQTTGKLSFAEVEEELREQLGRSPSRVEMFDACYTDVNGDPSCDEVGAALGEMKEVQSKLLPGSRDPVGPSDSFAKVMGQDPHGRVRMVGLGVNPSDISGGVPSRSTCYRMVLENQVAMARMEEKVDAATNFIASLQEKMQQNASNNVSTTRRPVSPSQSSNSINLEHTFQVGDVVFLKSLFNSRKNVAKGCVRSVDPNQDVGGKRIGLNWCEVQISVPIMWDEDLIRPYSNLYTIGDAIGACIAWPRHLVINANDQE